MPERPRSARPEPTAKRSPREQREYALMLEVERYESLVEDMEELGVTTIDQAQQRIVELHRKLDALGE